MHKAVNLHIIIRNDINQFCFLWHFVKVKPELRLQYIPESCGSCEPQSSGLPVPPVPANELQILFHLLFVIYNIQPLHQQLFFFWLILRQLCSSYNWKPGLNIPFCCSALLAENIQIDICCLLIFKGK